MYAGHFAAGLALKARVPKAPMWGLIVGIGLLDLIFTVLVVTGIEHITPTPGVAPGLRLDFIDWSHSLAMSIVWALVFALLFVHRGRTVALACGVAVLSHFVLDLPMHPRDLALWPHSPLHVGLGLWIVWPLGWWFFEGAFVLAGCLYYVRAASLAGERRSFGRRPFAVAAVVVIFHALNSPWLLGRS